LNFKSDEFFGKIITPFGQGDSFCQIWRDKLIVLFGLNELGARGSTWL